jgi:hypothetical protein
LALCVAFLWEEIATDLELLWTAESLPAEDDSDDDDKAWQAARKRVVSWHLLGEESRFFNSCCCASMLSAMVLEKAPESECDVWWLAVQHFEVVDGAYNITNSLSKGS